MLGAEVRALTQAGADMIHIDVMDGHFVPNLTFGAALVKAMRPYSSLPFDVHLMCSPVDSLLACFADAGADWITVHAEADCHVHRNLQKIRSLGKKVGLALNPLTSPAILDYLMDEIDLILVMTVNPGFGGQTFIDAQLAKITDIRRRIGNRPIALSVDGGITALTAPQAIQAGADVLVAGTAVFKTKDYAVNIQALRP